MLRISVNGLQRELPASSCTVADLVRALALEGKRIAVERNGEIVPKSRHADTSLGSPSQAAGCWFRAPMAQTLALPEGTLLGALPAHSVRSANESEAPPLRALDCDSVWILS